MPSIEKYMKSERKGRYSVEAMGLWSPSKGLFDQGYSDDSSMFACGTFESTLEYVMRMTLKVVKVWFIEKNA